MYDTRTMLEAIEQLKPVNTFLKDTFFPTPKTFDTAAVEVDYRKGKRKLAPFVSDRVAGKVVDREGFTTHLFEPATIKPVRTIQSIDLMKRSMGENVYGARSPQERAQEILANDITDLDEMITRREEWMAAQVLFEGKVDIVGEGVNKTMNFDFTNKETLSGTDLWTHADSDPLKDLKDTRRKIMISSGISPNTVIFSSDVVDDFVNHPKVSGLLNNRRITIGQIDPMAMPNGVTYIGNITELGCDIYTYDEFYYDEETQEDKSLVPDGTVMMGSTNSKSTMAYGAITIADTSNNTFSVVESTRVPVSFVQVDPAARFLQIHSKPLPIPHEVNSWAILKVK